MTMSDNRTTEQTATGRIIAMLRERGARFATHGSTDRVWWTAKNNVTWYAQDRPNANDLYVKLEAVLTPEQAIAATLGSDASAARLAERLRGIADEMRNVGASSMKPHELLACYASDVDKVADSLMFAATLGSEREKALEELVQDWQALYEYPDYGDCVRLRKRMQALGIEVIDE